MLWVGIAFACAALFWMPGLLEQFETPKIEVLRVCGLGALGAGLVAGRAGRPAGWGALDRAVAVWLAVEILATALSLSPRVSLVGETRQREGLLTSVGLAGLYFAARDVFARPDRVRVALDLALGLASLVGLYAMLQVTGQDPFQWRRQAVFGETYMRPFATLGHPNLLGVLTAAMTPVAVARAATARGWSRWLRGSAAAFLSLVTALTLSRAAWLGLAAGVATAAGLVLRERGIRRLPARGVALGAAAVVVAAVVVVAAGWGGLLVRRFGELLAGGGVTGSSRLEIWRAALAAWQERPLVGHGPDLFEMVFTRFQTPAYWRLEWSGLPFHAHSIYLHTLATRGVVGLLAALGWAATLLAAARSAWRGRGATTPPGTLPAAAGVLVSLAVAGAFGALGITGALLVVLASAMLGSAAEGAPREGAAGTSAAPGAVLAGTGRAAAAARGHAGPWQVTKPPARAARRGAGARRGSRVPRMRRWAARVAGAALAAAAYQWCFTELRASRAGAAARELMTSAPPRATQASGYATTLAPHDDRLWRMHAETLLWLTTIQPEVGPLLGEAEAAARRAVALAPARAENRLVLARALATREAHGDTTARAAAQAEFRMSFALAPMDGLNLMEYADHEALLGRGSSALAAARQAAALYPDEGAALAVLGRAHVAAGDLDGARRVLEQALRGGWRDAERRREAAQLLERLRAAPGRPAAQDR